MWRWSRGKKRASCSTSRATSNVVKVQRVAIISDIHGNVRALEAVLADIARRSVDQILCLGDLVGKGPGGAAVIDRCRALCEIILRGNWDDAIGSAQESPSATVRWHQAQIGRNRRAFLAQLPFYHDFVLSGRQIRLLHAAPHSLEANFHVERTYSDHLAMFGPGALVPADAPLPDIVLYGHSHRQGMLNLYREQKLLVNVGSVGNPTDMPLAGYALVEGLRDVSGQAPFSIQHVRVPYDIEQAIADARAAAIPGLDPYVIELRTAVYRGLQQRHV